MNRQKRSNRKNRAKEKSANGGTVKAEESPELCYRVEQSEVLGRYLVATRNLPAGEVVMCDEPLVVGPCQEARPLCVGCYVDIDLKDSLSYHRCEKCSWPLCSSECPGFHRSNGHSEEECALLSKSSAGGKEISEFEGFYYAFTPLRCLAKKGKCEETWKVLTGMESHTEQRRQSPKLWAANEKLAVKVIRDVLGLTQFSEDEIHLICGVLEVNAFEINTKSGMQCLRAVYSNAFLFAHNCVPNTNRSNESDFRLTVRTIRVIPANEMITVSYAYTLQCTLLRRKHLRETKFFSCTCQRCSDPTELATYTGAIRCLSCKVGFLLPEDPLNENSSWKCSSQKCNCQMEVSEIIPILDNLFEKLDSIDGNDVVAYEDFTRKCSTMFHENHYLCLSAIHCLSQLYGKINGYLINDLTDEQLERKEEICRKLLKVFDKLEPGLSKQRGILLYELQAPMMVLLRRRFGSIPKKELKSKIKTILKYLDESSLILSKEPEHSMESQMAHAAKEAINGLQEWLNFLN